MRSNRQRHIAEALADALLAGDAELPGYVARGAWVLGIKHRWLTPLCKRVFQSFGSSLDHRSRTKLIEWILADSGYQEAWRASRQPQIAHYVLDPPRMVPRRGALAACVLPSLATRSDLAAWLGITVTELEWFADVRNGNPSRGPLCNYRYAWVPKSYGARLMEAPKDRLRKIQRQILRQILDFVPAHRAAHGFIRGRSCRSYVEPHVGREVVLRVDLREFFTSIPASRIHALFTTLGYPEAVSRLLAGLCTNAVPISVARQGGESWLAAKRLGVPHLPQGAPTSPALANLSAFRLDLRLDQLARSLDAQYTRYADDLAISGGEALRRRRAKVLQLVESIAMEEGFAINHRKTRAMQRSHRQLLTGIVVNEKPNVRRLEFDRLKAILTNCLRHGTTAQNRDGQRDFRAHLSGRVAHVVSLNPERGKKLQAIFERIDWSDRSDGRD